MRQAGEGYFVMTYRSWMALLAWLLMVLSAMLMPAPREWGALGVWINPHYEDIRSVFNPAMHVVLMAIMALVTMQMFWYRKLLVAVACSFGLVVLLAVLFEILQGTLPREFGRSCDVADLVPGAFGAALGCLAGLIVRLRKTYK